MQRSEKVTFDGAEGHALAGRLDSPPGEPRAYALFAHCFTCTKDNVAAARIARALAESGIAVLRFDFTGLGGSEGDFANTDFSANLDDLRAAADFMRRRFQAPALVIGHSLGGTAVLAMAREVPEATAVVTINAPADPAHLRALLAPTALEAEARGEAEIDLGGRTFTIRKRFLDDLDAHDVDTAIAGLGKALLVFHAPRDDTVDVEQASRIFMAARHPKSFVSLDDADHLLRRSADAEYVGAVVAAWAARYLPAAAVAPVAPEAGTVVVEDEGGYARRIRAGAHVLAADEPVHLGGTDTGPGPYDLLLASLGACTSITIRMYADRKGMPLERITVGLRHAKIHAEDCAECETREGRIDRIDREIAFAGALSDAERAPLLEIADLCPVHRTLKSEIDIQTRQVPA